MDRVAGAEAWAAMAGAKLKEIGLRVQSRNGETSAFCCQALGYMELDAKIMPAEPEETSRGAAIFRVAFPSASQRGAIALHCLHVPDPS